MKSLYTKFLANSREVFKPQCTLYQYNDDYFRIVYSKCVRQKGFEDIKEKNNYIPKTDSEEVQRISISRSKKNIRELCFCNNFEYFATITVNCANADRFSLTECQNLLRKKLKKLKRKNKDFAFVFITEKHKDGAFHFHGMVKGLDMYINKNGYFSNKIFDEVGFNSFSKIKDYYKCCNYITKYITKDCVKNESNQIYFCSRGLKRADKYLIEPIDIEWSFENDFCKIKDFCCSDLTKEELFNFGEIKEIK